MQVSGWLGAYRVLSFWPILATTVVPPYSPALAVGDLIFAAGAANFPLSKYTLSFAEFELANYTGQRVTTECNLG
jgi:hypothetical protein